MPEEHHIDVEVKLSKSTIDKIKKIKEDPEIETDMKIFVEEHKAETGKEKVKEIRNIGQKFRKIILVAKYKIQ